MRRLQCKGEWLDEGTEGQTVTNVLKSNFDQYVEQTSLLLTSSMYHKQDTRQVPLLNSVRTMWWLRVDKKSKSTTDMSHRTAATLLNKMEYALH